MVSSISLTLAGNSGSIFRKTQFSMRELHDLAMRALRRTFGAGGSFIFLHTGLRSFQESNHGGSVLLVEVSLTGNQLQFKVIGGQPNDPGLKFTKAN